jgi:chlorophyllide a reductase subunit Z
VRQFLETELGLPCAYAIARTPGAKTDNEAVRETVRQGQALVVFGSFNERMYLAECGSRAMFIPASFPGAIVRRHTGTPFMGYAGATYLLQEVCNALFDALFHVLPLASDLDRIEPTPLREAGAGAPPRWDDAAQRLLDSLVAAEPVLVRISTAKRIRDQAEKDARESGEDIVTAARVARSQLALKTGVMQ